MSARKKPHFRKRCRAPKEEDGYPCKNPIKPEDHHCHMHPGLPRILDDADAPVYVPGSHDRLLRAGNSAASHSRFESDLMQSVVHYVDNVDGQWFDEVRSCGAEMVGGKLWRKASSRKAMHRCEYIRVLAQSSLDDDLSGFMFRMFLQSIFPCAGFEEALIGELVNGFEGVESGAPSVGAGRAMQLVGIHACLRHDRNPSRCRSARHVIEREGKDAFVNLLDQGARDWTGLAQLTPQYL